MKNFKKVFDDAIDELEREAHAVDMTMTSICRATKIGRSTPDRWRKITPTTVKLVVQMQEVVEAEKRRRANPSETFKADL